MLVYNGPPEESALPSDVLGLSLQSLSELRVSAMQRRHLLGRGLALASAGGLSGFKVTPAETSVIPGFAANIPPAVAPSRQIAAASRFSDDVSLLRTEGYQSAGDLGGALYKRAPAEPAHVGKFQSADGAWWEIAERTLNPFMFGGRDANLDPEWDSSFAVQSAIDLAGNWPHAGFAGCVEFPCYFRTTTTILKRPYVSLLGVGPGRSGLRPHMSSGPALDCDSVVNTSSAYLDRLERFTIDGAGASGSAYAIRLQGQKHVRLTQIGFWHFRNTTTHAVQILGSCYSVIFDQCNFLGNKRHFKVSATDVAASLFPTTVTIGATVFEDGEASGHEAILLQDASGVTFTDDCVFQSNKQKVLFRIVGGPSRATRHLHRWISPYIEDNGGGQIGARTWEFVGRAGNAVDWCEITGAKIHGAAPSGGHIYAEHTDHLLARDNSVGPEHKWLTDGGSNINYDIDARYVGQTDLQSTRYNTTRCVFDENGYVGEHDGVIPLTVVKSAPGRFDVRLGRALKLRAAYINVQAFDAAGRSLTCTRRLADEKTLRIDVVASGDERDGLLISPAGWVNVEICGEISPAG
ncbi:hypothetical protein BrevBR_05005 [Brevundimonas sp. BR2-1]|uniref:hypothetical protein n=1 Tax=Brevundimonas sp. BR2-1 TaxID=3031123 RepID=UPI0030B28DF0